MKQGSITAMVCVGTAMFCIGVASFMIVLSLAPMLDGTTAEGPLTASYKVDGDRFYVEYDPQEMVGYTEYFRGFSFTATAYRYVTPDDPTVQKLYRTALEPRMAGMDDYDRADYLRKFVQQNVTYDFDIGMHGMSDYTQYPSETLLTKRGDCEDSSILLHTLYRLAGLDSVLIESSDHIYVGVAVDGTGEHVVPPLSNTRYYTVEPTSPWAIGKYGHDEDWHFVYHPHGVLVAEICLFFAMFGLISMWIYRNVRVEAVTLHSGTAIMGETQ